MWPGPIARLREAGAVETPPGTLALGLGACLWTAQQESRGEIPRLPGSQARAKAQLSTAARAPGAQSPAKSGGASARKAGTGAGAGHQGTRSLCRCAMPGHVGRTWACVQPSWSPQELSQVVGGTKGLPSDLHCWTVHSAPALAPPPLLPVQAQSGCGYTVSSVDSSWWGQSAWNPSLC